MALNGLICADVPLRIYSLTHSDHRFLELCSLAYIASFAMQFTYKNGVISSYKICCLFPSQLLLYSHSRPPNAPSLDYARDFHCSD